MARKKSIKQNIPWELHIALIKLQGRQESTYEEACIKAAQMMDTNSAEFKKAVADETRKIEKSQIMSKANKNRKTWTDKGYKKGRRDGDSQGYQRGVSEYRINYPCSICGKEIVMQASSMLVRSFRWMFSSSWRSNTSVSSTFWTMVLI